MTRLGWILSADAAMGCKIFVSFVFVACGLLLPFERRGRLLGLVLALLVVWLGFCLRSSFILQWTACGFLVVCLWRGCCLLVPPSGFVAVELGPRGSWWQCRTNSYTRIATSLGSIPKIVRIADGFGSQCVGYCGFYY